LGSRPRPETCWDSHRKAAVFLTAGFGSMDVLVILFLIVLNGGFAMSEMAVVSSRKARLQQGQRKGKPALWLLWPWQMSLGNFCPQFK